MGATTNLMGGKPVLQTIKPSVLRVTLEFGSYYITGQFTLGWNDNGCSFLFLQMFHKSRLRKLRVSPTETAMMDVLREVKTRAYTNT